MPISKVFHAGELAVQEHAGAPEAVHRFAETAIRDHLTLQHREFFVRLPFLVAAAADDDGLPWCTVLWGEPGFARALSDSLLTVLPVPSPGDPLLDHLTAGSYIGLLGIELHSKRRNRLNGTIASSSIDGGFTVNVQQSYGNCPKHITPRFVEPTSRRAGPIESFDHLTAPMIELIRRADTFFIASSHRGPESHRASGFDASHRGGLPGFVKVESELELTFPDYAGNNLFNTLGNLWLDPKAGLLFIDFKAGTLLHLTGQITIEWNSPSETFQDDSGNTAQRLLKFRLDRGIMRATVLPLRFVVTEGNELAGVSPKKGGL